MSDIVERLRRSARPAGSSHYPDAYGSLASCALVAEAAEEITRLRAQRDKAVEALREILLHCANAGRGNEIVDSRIVDRVDDTARATLAEIGGE